MYIIYKFDLFITRLSSLFRLRHTSSTLFFSLLLFFCFSFLLVRFFSSSLRFPPSPLPSLPLLLHFHHNHPFTMDVLTQYSQTLETKIEQFTTPLKPYIPILARFLLIVTFLEDALRIMLQWSDQLWYLEQHRGFPTGLSHLFLFVNVVVMSVASTMAVLRFRTGKMEKKTGKEKRG